MQDLTKIRFSRKYFQGTKYVNEPISYATGVFVLDKYFKPIYDNDFRSIIDVYFYETFSTTNSENKSTGPNL
jgi:hypothetical protein